MFTWRPLLTLLLMGAMSAVFSGCAPAYHSYEDCYIDCRYCPPPPLPWPEYPPCVCHSEPAEEYVVGGAATADRTQPAPEPAGVQE